MNDDQASPAGRSRILIVDDDPDIRFLLRSLLAPYAVCDEAGDGIEAVERVRAAMDAGENYALVLLDLMLPGRDGLAALQDIRRLENERRVPPDESLAALMITAVSDPDMIWGAHFDGLAAGYLVKPVKHDVLLRRLREMDIIP